MKAPGNIRNVRKHGKSSISFKWGKCNVNFQRGGAARLRYGCSHTAAAAVAAAAAAAVAATATLGIMNTKGRYVGRLRAIGIESRRQTEKRT